MVKNHKRKKLYLTPKIEITIIAMEEGIAAGSANIQPGDNTGSVKSEWETADDNNSNMGW
ncbi:MAG: hypothetical protein K0R59_2333 [Sphingobacterium sp.]|jgi:hypothetical protein|uniref:hypothetical protein n=1 Tax=Sphingobacterium sp. NGMCC 1.201703 TaxID=3388657 RepID=UPI002A5B361C|nr:hypothetical protein [Sphingobacterium sp.]